MSKISFTDGTSDITMERMKHTVEVSINDSQGSESVEIPHEARLQLFDFYEQCLTIIRDHELTHVDKAHLRDVLLGKAH